jgi:hypothetical protein
MCYNAAFHLGLFGSYSSSTCNISTFCFVVVIEKHFLVNFELHFSILSPIIITQARRG